ncbi:MAG: hypothetical protein WBD22_07660 [Pyrinomonadaceae bacterium]
MLIDEFLPEYDFVERHVTRVRAKASEVFRAVNEVDFGESWIIRTLFFLRGLSTGNITLREMREGAFETLGEKTDHELLLGLVGQPWKPSGGLKKVEAVSFKEFAEAGFAKMAWNFAVEEADGRTQLLTETRIKCLDPASRRKFGFYWTFIGPFSGLIRMEMLQAIKRQAELGV